MILEFSQNGYIRREFELPDSPSARELVHRLNRKSIGRGAFYWRGYRYSRWDGCSNWTVRDLDRNMRREQPCQA